MYLVGILYSYKHRVLKVKVAQSCPTLYDPMATTWNSPGQNTGVGSLSLLQGIFPTQGLNPGILQARTLEWVAFPFSRGIFPTQGLNPGLPPCRQILYQLCRKGSPISIKSAPKDCIPKTTCRC